MKQLNGIWLMLGLLLAVTVDTSYGQDQAKNPESRRVQSDDKAFSIIVPAGWNNPIPVKQGSSVILAFEGKSIFFGTGIMKVAKITFPQKVNDLQSLARGDIDRSKGKLTRFELHEESEMTIKKRKAYFYSYSYLLGEGKDSWMGTLSSYIIGG